MSELHAALRGVVDGHGGSFSLEGVTGIGKSRLLAEAEVEARRRRAAIAAGNATPLDRLIPLSTMLNTLRCDLAPGLDLSRFEQDDLYLNRWRLIDQLTEIIEEYVRSRPLVFILDDAQWTDELSAMALRMLVPALSSQPVLWLLARRELPPGRPAQEAIDWLINEGTRRITLGSLDADAAGEICAHALGATPDETVTALAATCAGNPFLLEELCTKLRDTGGVEVSDSTATVISDGLPTEFLHTVRGSLPEISEDALRVLQVGSVLGRPFSAHDAAELLDAKALDLAPAADEAIRSGILVDDGQKLAFRHDVNAEAVYNGLSTPRRSVLHRRAADLARSEGRSPHEIAEHVSKSGQVVDGDVVAELRKVVDESAHRAPSTTADLVLRMVARLDDRDPARPPLVADAVRLLASAGRVAEARQLADRALHSDLDPSDEGALLLGFAEALKHAGYNAAVVEYTRRALANSHLATGLRAQLLAVQAHGLLSVYDLPAAERASTAAVDLARPIGEHSALVFGMVAQTVLLRAGGRLDEAVTLAREAVETGDSAGSEAGQRHARLWLTPALTATDRFTEAEAVCEFGQRDASRLGSGWSQPLWHYHRARLRIATGQLNDAATEAETGIRVAEQLTAMALAVPLLGVAAYVALLQDDAAAARSYRDRASRLLAEGITAGPEDVEWPAALAKETDGESEGALAGLEVVLQRLPDDMLLLTLDVRVAPTLVRMTRNSRHREQAGQVVEASETLAERNPSVWSLTGAARHARGLLTDDVAQLHAAVAAHRQGSRPLGLASALEDTALAERAEGNTKRAITLLEEATGVYLDCGAARDLARARQRLDRLGGRGKSSTGTTMSGWQTLTESEKRVARLVAEGMTNREVATRLFLSRHTVDSHLRHSFTKLGVSSRVELTREVIANRENEGG